MTEIPVDHPEPNPERIIAAVVCDFTRTAIGTRSRLADLIAGKPVLQRVLDRLLAVEELAAIALLVPPEQMNQAQSFAAHPRIHLLELIPRSPAISARIRAGRQWNLQSWRGGAGQYTVFDEEYHPAAIAHACKHLAADHVLIVHSHGIFLDVPMTRALLAHHLHKNHEMKVTYTPSAPGLCGMVLRAEIVHEMAETDRGGRGGVLPWQLLSYDPSNPTFDTLIREACMQVDPALSKIPNRFCVDTDRSWAVASELLADDQVTRRPGDRAKEPDATSSPPHLVPLSPCHPATLSAAELALAAARSVAPGVKDLSQIHPQPRELEIELTGKRLTNPPGAVPALIREARGELDPRHWQRWFARNHFPDDLLLTFAGDGDPLLYPHWPAIVQSARDAGIMAICLQTDLATDNIDPVIAAISGGLVDTISITSYGHTQATYAKVANADLHGALMKNLTRLAPIISANGGIPLVVPRLLKVRDTIPEIEPFFDAWITQAGWAVIDAPTDRAGAIPFAGVIDMAPPKRRPCRRLWDRLLIRANGNAIPCDQDMNDRLILGNIESATLAELWTSPRLAELRHQHAQNLWRQITPCTSCKEWHRP